MSFFFPLFLISSYLCSSSSFLMNKFSTFSTLWYHLLFCLSFPFLLVLTLIFLTFYPSHLLSFSPSSAPLPLFFAILFSGLPSGLEATSPDDEENHMDDDTPLSSSPIVSSSLPSASNHSKDIKPDEEKKTRTKSVDDTVSRIYCAETKIAENPCVWDHVHDLYWKEMKKKESFHSCLTSVSRESWV